MNNQKKGFTLVELSITSLIAMLIFAAALSLYISAWRSLTIGTTYLDSYAGARKASGWLIRDIKCAVQVKYQTDNATFQTGDHVIVLKVPSLHKDTKKIISAYYDYIIYTNRLESGDLMRIVQIDSRFTNAADPNYNKNYRNDATNDVITRHCKELTFSSWSKSTKKWEKLSSYTDDAMMKEINAISVYLPINEQNISIGGTVTQKINPTTAIRLRNK
jgi:hypothetical protein